MLGGDDMMLDYLFPVALFVLWPVLSFSSYRIGMQIQEVYFDDSKPSKLWHYRVGVFMKAEVPVLLFLLFVIGSHTIFITWGQ